MIIEYTPTAPPDDRGLVDGYHGGKMEDIWFEVHAVDGTIPQ